MKRYLLVVWASILLAGCTGVVMRHYPRTEGVQPEAVRAWRGSDDEHWLFEVQYAWEQPARALWSQYWEWLTPDDQLPDVAWEPALVSATDRPRDGVFLDDEGRLWIYRGGAIEGSPQPRTRRRPVWDDPELLLLYPLATACDIALTPLVLVWLLAVGNS